MSNLALYMIGAVLVAAAVTIALLKMNVAPIWVIIVALVIVGVGLMGGVSRTRQREDSPAD
jgi:hypothetical protein